MVSRATLIPLQGAASGQVKGNPTIVPNMDPSASSGNGTVDHLSPQQFIAGNPRADATASLTVGGSITAGDSVGINVTCAVLPNGLLGFAYTVQGGDTTTTIAENLADLVNDSVIAANVGLRADAAGAILTLHWNGPVGNFAKVTGVVNPAVPTDLFGGTATANDVNILELVGPNFLANYQARQISSLVTTSILTLTQMAQLMVTAINADTVLAGLGVTAIATTQVASLQGLGPLQPVVITAWSNGKAETATIGGSVVNGDTLVLTITNRLLPTGSVALTISIVGADTTTTIAAKLVAAINANLPCASINLKATNLAAVVSMTVNANVGPVTYARTNGSSATLTLGGGPTETQTIGGATTATITASATFTGGSGPVIPVQNFNWSFGGSAASFFYGKPANVDYATLSAMIIQGKPIV